MTRSLVIAPQWIGDAVMTEPLLRRLHNQGQRLTVGALPWVAPVYRAMPQVAEVVELPFQHGGLQFAARRRLARDFNGRFDVAYVLPNSIKSALLPLLAGIPKRVGYLGLLTHRLKNPPRGQRPPMVTFYSRLSGDAQSDIAQDRPRLWLDAANVAKGVAELGLQPGGYYVFAPGAEYGSAKRWPAAHYAELAAQLDLPVLLLGSAKEADLCEEIAAPVNARQARKCLNLAGKTSLTLALYAIAATKKIVSNDSGLMHVAAAFGVPQVAVFGSSSPIHTPPISEKAVVLWLKNEAGYQPPLDCAPCFKRECPLPKHQGHLRCLRDISPARILHLMLA
jgi:heptosyltransferase II